jgi:hypothetical protein
MDFINITLWTEYTNGYHGNIILRNTRLSCNIFTFNNRVFIPNKGLYETYSSPEKQSICLAFTIDTTQILTNIIEYTPKVIHVILRISVAEL